MIDLHSSHHNELTVQNPFTEAEWASMRAADLAAARAVVILMVSIFCTGIVIYSIVAWTVADPRGPYGFLADIIVAVHVGYICYVIFGQLLILFGLLLGWKWIRNPWFRWSHLLMISIVALESLGGVRCPLTTWEYQLRELAGQKIDAVQTEDGTVEQPSFIGKLLHDVMFFEAMPHNASIFTIAYVSFALLVLGTFGLAPPRRFRQGRAGSVSDGHPKTVADASGS